MEYWSVGVLWLDRAAVLCDCETMSTDKQARDRFVAREVAAMTPAQRLERFRSLQAAAFERLRQSPSGWEAFMRRNISKRAIRHAAHD